MKKDLKIVLILNQSPFPRIEYDQQTMVEMDRFVYDLRGSREEIIQRKSTESAATMKEQISTIEQ